MDPLKIFLNSAMGGVIRAGFPALCPRTPDVERSPEHGHNKAANNRGGSGQKAVSGAVTEHALVARRAQAYGLELQDRNAD